ncbi:hypothetical protein LGH70_18645 [Hymenobacter sp. BT635]|uniref:Lipoprotein n=1 Tax=Hymenobacter nitidus TaxID=2880929 RepID=A0ABS8AGZ8_9BACT|nr:hypothetical protein [Hymenobacter nitidus]MCB2379622.1 hypothetical protein [Hymenobacter nitidus]
MRIALSLILLAAVGAAGCQPTADQTNAPAAAETTAPAPAATTAPDATSGQVTTAAQALGAVNFYLQEMPEGGEYDFDAATAREADAHWLVLVPSLPGDGRKPNTATFEVDKQTGDIQVRFAPLPAK